MIYHSSINENVSVDDVLKLGIKSCLDIDVSIIIENEYKIQFKKNKESISYCDEFELQQVFRKAYKKSHAKNFNGLMVDKLISL